MITIKSLHHTIAHLLAPSLVPAKLGDIHHQLTEALKLAGVDAPQKKYIFEAIAAHYPLLKNQAQKKAMVTINAEALAALMAEAKQLASNTATVATSQHLAILPTKTRRQK